MTYDYRQKVHPQERDGYCSPLEIFTLTLRREVTSRGTLVRSKGVDLGGDFNVFLPDRCRPTGNELRKYPRGRKGREIGTTDEEPH